MPEASGSNWKPASPRLELAKNDIHLFKIDLPACDGIVSRLQLTLSDDELVKAQRFYFARERKCFTVVRGLLRSILAGYLHREARTLRFHYGTNGKPRLEEFEEGEGMCFNVSHSGDLALIAVSLDRRVGIDIEFKDPKMDFLGVAASHFAKEEIASLAVVSQDSREVLFYATWAAKESYIKARGEGVSLGLDSFAFRNPQSSHPTLLRSDHEDDLGRWSFWKIDADPQYAATLAAERAQDAELQLWSFAPDD